ncbi:MAG: YbaN family protein [Spirochaetaceae bacterium]|jgi:uncharacterized membrane protein YbaN (DUF454 family)|nr:YbaN family protein [Spirochaetaceae bacterium]
MLKILFIIGGFISLFLGVLGIFLPLLPTTPFLLLSAACFFRSSPRLYSWLIGHKIFGRYILCYREYQAIPTFARWFTLILLWSVMGTTAFVFIDLWWVRIVLFFIASSVSIHLLTLKKVSPEMLERVEELRKTS